MTKILLVEDDKSLREIYGVRLLAEGYDIVSAGDGEEALAMAIKERPDLIISDVMMPKISGFDMLDILRSTTETRNIRVIMMTALSSDDQRTRGEQLGADRYLVKSQVGIEDVVHTVHEVMADSGTPAAAPATAPTASDVPAAPSDAEMADSLPQPTAPFSTPKPDNLGERVINPLPRSDDNDSIASKIETELANADTPSPVAEASIEPIEQPTMEPVVPITDSMPVQPQSQPESTIPEPAFEPTPVAEVAEPVAAEPASMPEPVAAPAPATDPVSDEPAVQAAPTAPIVEPSTVSADDVTPDPAVTQVENTEATEQPAPESATPAESAAPQPEETKPAA